MRLIDVKEGMRATLLVGKGPNRKPLGVVVVGFRHVKHQGRLVKHVVVKPLNGQARQLVRHTRLHDAGLYDAAVHRQVIAEQRKRLEAERLDVFNLLVRSGIVPRSACLSDDGRVFELQIPSNRLQPLAQLLRGRHGFKNDEKESNETSDEGEWCEWSEEDWREWTEAGPHELPRSARIPAGGGG